MTPDAVLARVLDLVLRQRHDPGNHIVFVSSPPGGGKTQLVELVAVAACQLGLQVAIACPRAEQAFALVRRLTHAYPTQRLRLLVGKDRPLPADLQAQAIPLGAGGVNVGPSSGMPVVVGTVAKLALLAASGAVTCDLLIADEAFQVTLADLAPLLPCADRFLLVGDPGQLPPLVLIDPSPLPLSATASMNPPLRNCGATGLPPHICDYPRLTASHLIPCRSCSRCTRTCRFVPQPRPVSAG